MGLDTKKVIIICCAILGAIIIFFAIVFLLYKKLSMTKAKPAPEEDVDVIDENEYEYQYHPKAEWGRKVHDVTKKKKKGVKKSNKIDNLRMSKIPEESKEEV